MKKILAFAAILCMIMNITVFAAEEDKLGEAITTVKKVISIQEEYSEFNYSSQNRGGTKLWVLEWTGDNGYINIAADEEGNIISYYAYENSDASGLTDLTEDDAKAAAESFMKTVMPKEAGSMKLKSSSAGHRFYLEYEQIMNGLPERFNTCSIGVDKYSCKVTEFDRFIPSGREYENISTVISEAEAKEKYIEQIDIELQYADSYDYKEKTLKIFPVYTAGGNNKAISAITGEVTDLSLATDESMKNLAGGGAMMSQSEEMAADKGFTPEEKAAIEEVAGFMSEEETAEKIKKALPVNKEDISVVHNGLYKNEQLGGVYYRNFRIKSDDEFIGNAVVEAKSGRLISFYLYKNTEKAKKINEEEAKKKAEDFIKKHAEKEFSQTAENDDVYYIPLRQDTLPSSYSFSYSRVVNGIKYPSNGINITYDNETGMITSYSLQWNEKAVFPDISNVKTKKEIMEYADNYLDFGLIYVGGKAVYDFKTTSSVRMNPFSGQRINYDGSEYEEIKRVEYTDISGHWAENYILKLWNNNIYKSSEKFMPDEVITQKEFADFIYGRKVNDNTVKRLYEFMPEEDVLPDEPLTRGDAAKAIVGYLGFERIPRA